MFNNVLFNKSNSMEYLVFKLLLFNRENLDLSFKLCVSFHRTDVYRSVQYFHFVSQYFHRNLRFAIFSADSLDTLSLSSTISLHKD